MTDKRGRDGKFLSGNAGGPGRPRREKERQYFDTIANAVSFEAWQAVVERALVDAKAGDAKARDWLARYLLPDEKPVDPSPPVKESPTARMFRELRESVGA